MTTSVQCLIRVIGTDLRDTVSVEASSVVQVQQHLAARLGIASDLVVVVHDGEPLDPLLNLIDIAGDFNDLALVAFIVDREREAMADEICRFETILVPEAGVAIESVPLSYEIPLNEALEFLGSNVPRSLREPLMALGFPEARVLKALLLNSLNLQRALNWLVAHANDPNVDASLTPIQISQLMSQIIISQNAEAGGDPRARENLLQSVQQALSRRQCSFSVSRNRFVPQQYRSCRTCTLDNGRGICLACAEVCHAGHDLGELRSSDDSFCNCGSGEGPFRCRCL
uniref:UBR-type domain-containing protein n=1 Tax=Spongospora subterranea TaxID=70186 RepID=A0A0H5RQ96_9EUKA|eukprot:CRZ10879.1 hypothetical protein [Spongospora subterranea]